ncbi:uncharacterized protein LOC111055986 [Nilaparvata lugens]|uniref:uncharacterized protein LOC111055986 n=1 Tax=Nilaparvata lugens TaxID=108931 RepID=UPI00193D0571|nr:uncharacterized protein LOC111055986 [Nilaparvata lugens]
MNRTELTLDLGPVKATRVRCGSAWIATICSESKQQLTSSSSRTAVYDELWQQPQHRGACVSSSRPARDINAPRTRSQASDSSATGSIADEGRQTRAEDGNGRTSLQPLGERPIGQIGDGLGPLNEAPVAPNRLGRRMKWTREMNISIMHAYYRSTKVETEKEGYRQRMCAEWKQIYPESNLDEQRVCSQLNSIQRRRVLSEAELHQLKQEILIQLEIVPDVLDIEPQGEEQLEEREATEQEIGEAVDERVIMFTEIEDEDNELQMLRDLHIENKLLYTGIDVQDRPHIPRAYCNLKFHQMCTRMDHLLSEEVYTSLEELVSGVQIGALTVCMSLGLKVRKRQTRSETQQKRAKNEESHPPWRRRIEEKIKKARKVISHIAEFLTDGRGCGKKTLSGVKSIAWRMGLRMKDKFFLQKLREEDEHLRQRIAALGSRIRRYNEAAKRRKDETDFATRQRDLYRQLEGDKGSTQQHFPDKKSMEEFWGGIWSVPKQHSQSYWLQDENVALQDVPRMAEVVITAADVKKAISKTQNWKAPGIDGIHNVWWKYLPSTHPVLANLFQEAIQQPDVLKDSFSMGITYMLPKKKDSLDPKDYRPITCLPTIYKLLTSVLTANIHEHLANNELLAPEQNGCRKGSQGCKELLLIDGIISQQVRKRSHNVSVGWVDYRKAFDSVPHSWLRHVLDLYKVSPGIVNFLSGVMTQWTTTLQVGWGSESYRTQGIPIRRGIFQGDSLSPLWFCMALNPLSRMLRDSGYGYVLKRNPQVKVSHSLYMDDLKVYAANQDQLKNMLQLVKNFSDSICMEFGLEKCKVLHVKRGQISGEGDGAIQLTEEVLIQSLGRPHECKYLGLAQLLCRADTVIRREFQRKTVQRLEKVCRTGLSSRNKISAINTWAVPVAMYTFGIVKWTDTALQEFDRKVRTTLTKNRLHHPRSSIQRLYLPRGVGGRGLLSLETMCRQQEDRLRKYFQNANSGLLKAVCLVDREYSPLQLAHGVQQLTASTVEERLEAWKQKELHGRFAAALHSDCVDRKESIEWLQTSGIFGETEGFMFAIQDQVISTRAYKRYVMGLTVDSSCRLCRKAIESIQHICGGCSVLANTEYLQRHNDVAKVVHQAMAKRYELIASEVPYYKCKPEMVLNGEKGRLLWDCCKTTDRAVEANRPDIVLFDRKNKEAYIIDVAVPLDENLVSTIAEKKRKYQPLSVELKDMYKLRKVVIIPIVVSANGLVTKEWRQAMEQLQLENWHMRIMQKAAVLGTTNIYSRRNTVEIYGVPSVADEDVAEVVLQVCKTLNMDVNKDSIDACHRLRKRENRPTAGIAVRFVRRSDVETLLQRRKMKGDLNTQHMGFIGDAKPVYINRVQRNIKGESKEFWKFVNSKREAKGICQRMELGDRAFVGSELPDGFAEYFKSVYTPITCTFSDNVNQIS